MTATATRHMSPSAHIPLPPIDRWGIFRSAVAVRVDPVPSVSALVANAVRRLTESPMQYERLLEMAAHGRAFLGAYLVAAVERSPELRAWMSAELPDGVQPGPDAWMGALFSHLLRAGPDDAHPRDEVPFEVLYELGQEGALLAAMLVSLDDRSRNIAIGPQELAEMHAVLGRTAPRAAAMLRPLIDVDDIQRPPPPTATVTGVLRLGPDAKAVRFDTILHHLAYGSTKLIARLAKEIDDNPRSPLSNALKTRGRQQFDGTRRAGLAARLLRILDNFRDPHDPLGINLELFVQTYGAAGREIADLLIAGAKRPVPERANYRFMSQIVDALSAMMGPRHALPLVDRLVRNDRLIPKRVPAVEHALEMIAAGRFTDQGLVAVQHMFPTLIPLLEAFERKGMKARDIHVLGTKYASNPLVAAYGRLKGYHLEASLDDAGATRSFEELRIAEVTAFLGSVHLLGRKPPKGWIALDDGGLLNGVLSGFKRALGAIGQASDVRASIASVFGDVPIHGVEQTTRGLTELGDRELDYFVVTVANALGKIEEGGIIAWDLTKALLLELFHCGLVEKIERMGVVSGGTVGIGVAERLAHDLHYDVFVADQDETKRQRIRDAGFAAFETVEALAAAVDLLFPCTGKRSVNGYNLRDFEGVLASGSSAAIEGDTDHIEAFNASITILNWLRPLNFSGDGHEQLSKEQIGLTRALLLLACAQELPEDGPPRAVKLREDHLEVVDFWKKTGGDRTAPLSRVPRHTLEPPDRVGGLGRAPHDEWMTFFMNHPGRVHPPPTMWRHQEGVFFFELPDGQVRAVDTRVGRSFDTGLERFPDSLFFTGVPPGDFDVLVRGVDEEGRRWLQPFYLDTRELLVADRIEAGELMARYVPPYVVPDGLEVQDADSLAAANGLDRSISLVFERKDDLVLFSGGGGEPPVALPRPTQAPCHYLWPEAGTLLAIEKAGGRVHAVEVGEPPHAWRDVRLPVEMMHVDAVVSQLAAARGIIDPIAVGRDAEDRILVAPLETTPSQAVRLPKGAVFRGAAKKDPDDPRSIYSVRYSLEGEVDELEHHHTVDVVFAARP